MVPILRTKYYCQKFPATVPLRILSILGTKYYCQKFPLTIPLRIIPLSGVNIIVKNSQLLSLLE